MSRKPRPFATLDCETDPFLWGRLPKPFAWGYFDGTEYVQWWGSGRENEVAAFLETIDPRTIVYAHNGGRFDFHYLTPWLNPDRPPSIFNGRLARAWIGSVEIRDSYLILPFPLSAYQKDAMDYQTMERESRERHRKTILEYMRNDCVYLHELIGEFWEEHGPKLTIAQAAIAAWRRIQGTKRPRSQRAFDEEMRPFYFGGRCEARTRGRFGAARVYDLNSAYPAAMQEPHACGSFRQRSKRLPTTQKRLGRCFAVIEARSQGALPRRTLSGGLDFPETIATFHATGWEIMAGLETDRLKIHKVLRCDEFAETQDFGPYVDHYFERKADAKAAGDRARELVYKFTLNSLYGKFGQDPSNQRVFRLCDLDQKVDLEAEGWNEYAIFDPWYVVAKERPGWESGFLNVATAASITGHVRATMLRAIARAGTVHYCDTDSLVTPATLPTGKGLGEWDLEADLAYGWVGGKKLYAFREIGADGKRGWKTASKGARLKPAQIVEVCKGKVIEWQNEAPTFSVKRDPVFLTRNIRST